MHSWATGGTFSYTLLAVPSAALTMMASSTGKYTSLYFMSKIHFFHGHRQTSLIYLPVAVTLILHHTWYLTVPFKDPSLREISDFLKVSVAKRRRVKIAPSPACVFPFVRKRSKNDPQAPRDTLSKISKSIISFGFFPLNHIHFSCPIAPEEASRAIFRY